MISRVSCPQFSHCVPMNHRSLKQSFGQRRKTIWNSLKNFNIPENKKEDTIFAKRPEQLSVSDFIYLTNLVGNENI